jgi:hypothetical protein
MKRIYLSVLIGVGIVAAILQILSGSEAARTGESYPLVCRGSETFKIDASTPPCEGCINVGDAPKYVGFTFIRGSKPSGKGLAPGECSRLDRGMWADEPNVLLQEIDSFGGTEKYAWTSELHSPDSYWIFNVHNSRGRLLATGAERSGKHVVSDKGRLPGSVEVRSPDLYIAEVKVTDPLLPFAGTTRLAVRVGNKGTADAGEVILDLKRMRVCKDHPIPRSYRQMAVPALKAGQEEWIYFDGFDREWGTYITREGKDGSRLELMINPSDLYPDCTTVSPVMNYEKTEKERANNSFVFDPKAP